MNEHLFTNNDGLRLITQFEGAPRLKARRCEGGAWELSYGVTFYPDGSPVREGDTCTEEEAMAMFRHALQVFEEAVKRLVTVPLTSHQFSALVAFCYNIGESNMASSTVLKEVNAGRFDDAAAAFGMWVFATLDGYKQAFRGLLRRRYAEAACFLGYDWTEACADEAIALQREKPASLPGKDRVIYKTPFKDVLRVAQRYPLSPATQPAPEAKPAPAAIPDSAIAIPNTPAALPQADAKGGGASLATQPVSAPPAPAQNSAASTSSGPSRDVVDKGVVQSAPVAPPPAVSPKPKEPVVAPPLPKDAAPASLEPKDMVLSKRFWGLFITGAGTLEFLPGNISKWINNEGNRELLAWIAVVVIGYILYKYGQRKATKPLK